MSIQPEYTAFGKLIQDKLFHIPEYQRAYSWKTRQRQDLLDDILSVLTRPDTREHFMATIVCLNKNEEKEIGTESYVSVDIVDGQQRLTSLLILLKAIGKALLESHADESAKVNEILTKGDDSIVLLQTNHDETMMFVNYLRYGTVPDKKLVKLASDKNIYDAIMEAESFMEEHVDEAIELLKVVKNRLTFVYYQIEDERIVYSVFEVLNSRGLDVDWLDKCKSILMGAAFEGAASSTVVNELHTLWKEIYKLIGITNIDGGEIIRFAATLHSDEVESKTLSSSDALDYFKKNSIDSAKKSLEFSEWIRKITEQLVPLHKSKRLSAITKISHARLLAVAIKMHDELSGTEREVLLNHWEKITFKVFGLSEKDARTGVGDYTRLSHQIIKKNLNGYEDIAGALREFSKQYPIGPALDKLRSNDCYNGWESELRYLLFKYEEHLCTEAGENLCDEVWEKIWSTSAAKTIEHIYPQNPKDKWPGFLGRGRNQHEKYVNQLGNLILLPPGMNSRLGNDPFSVKKPQYKGLGLRHVENITRRREWRIEYIKNRGETILEWAQEVWADI